MKILFVSYSLCNGGAERVLASLANQFVNMGVETEVLLYQRNEGEYYLDEKVQIIEMGNEAYHGKNVVARSLNRIKFIRKILKTEQPDVVIPFLDVMVTESKIGAIFLNTKVVATVRNSPFQTPETAVGRFFRNIIFEFCDGVFVQNIAQKGYFSKNIQKKTFVVANPVSNNLICSEKQYSADVKSFVTCGRLHSQKNHKMLVNAFSKFLKKHPDCILKIYGVGPVKKELEEHIVELGLSNNVFCMGRTENVQAVLEQSDCFVLSSDFEGMPNALMEAMAVGVPCISTDCPTGPSDLIENYRSGLLTEVNNADKMADALCYMAEHPDDAIAMGQNAKKYISENYSEKFIADKLLNNLKEKVL